MAEQPRMPTNWRFQDLTGQRFARLTAISCAGSVKRQTLWICRCDCGAEKLIAANDLRTGHTRSCGCLRVVHGHSRRGQASRRPLSRTYSAWRNARSRCRSGHRDAQNYGDRGIAFSSAWDDFAAFLRDMGECPPGMSLDRIDNNGNYEPGNCRWATAREQHRNKRTNRIVQFHGEEMSLAEAIERSGLTSVAVRARLKIGWPMDKALSTPILRSGA